jgi:hypothetical protein
MVLIGGGTGYTVRTLLENLLGGFFRGLKDSDPDARFRSITICELDPQRMAEIKSEIYRLSSTALFNEIDVILDEVPVEPEDGFGRPGVGRRLEPAYLLFRQEEVASGKLVYKSSILSSTARASLITDFREVATQDLDDHLGKLDKIVQSNDAAGLEEFGLELTNKILPTTVSSELVKSPDYHLVVVHDAPSSRIPWETICIRPTGSDAKVWSPAKQAGLSHRLHSEKLPLATWLDRRKRQAGINLLLVVDPLGDLRDAQKEGDRIGQLAAARADITVKRLVREQATVRAVQDELRFGEYDVMHYAGHASFSDHSPADSGLRCSDGVLRAADLEGLANLPSLMFFNACESARVRKDSFGSSPVVRREIASRQVENSFSVAERILRGGVANFLGTYWPVGDEAAKHFSQQFYSSLLNGDCLGDSIQKGRTAAAAASVDWADYVFYGSYDFKLKES